MAACAESFPDNSGEPVWDIVESLADEGKVSDTRQDLIEEMEILDDMLEYAISIKNHDMQSEIEDELKILEYLSYSAKYR